MILDMASFDMLSFFLLNLIGRRFCFTMIFPGLCAHMMAMNSAYVNTTAVIPTADALLQDTTLKLEGLWFTEIYYRLPAQSITTKTPSSSPAWPKPERTNKKMPLDCCITQSSRRGFQLCSGTVLNGIRSSTCRYLWSQRSRPGSD